MKPNVVSATTSTASSPLTALPTAKIVRHPRAKMEPEGILLPTLLAPPDEETLRRLNVLAKQHPFCRRHKSSNSPLL